MPTPVDTLSQIVERFEGTRQDGSREEELNLVMGLGVFPLQVSVIPDSLVGCVHSNIRVRAKDTSYSVLYSLIAMRMLSSMTTMMNW